MSPATYREERPIARAEGNVLSKLRFPQGPDQGPSTRCRIDRDQDRIAAVVSNAEKCAIRGEVKSAYIIETDGANRRRSAICHRESVKGGWPQRARVRRPVKDRLSVSRQTGH